MQGLTVLSAVSVAHICPVNDYAFEAVSTSQNGQMSAVAARKPYKPQESLKVEPHNLADKVTQQHLCHTRSLLHHVPRWVQVHPAPRPQLH